MKRFLFFFMVCLVTLSAGAAVVPVSPGEGTVAAAVNAAAAGDTLELTTGDYTETSNVTIDKAITLQAAAGTTPLLNMKARFTVNVAGVTFDGLTLKGTDAEGIRYYTATGNQKVKNCSFEGYTSRVIRIYTGKASLDSLEIQDCLFQNITGRVLECSAKDMMKYLGIIRSTFMNITATDKYFIYLNYGESSVDGTRVDIDHCTFYNCIDRRGAYFYNVNDVHVTNCIAMLPEEVNDTKSFSVYGDKSEITNTISYNVSVYGDATKNNISSLNPYFLDAANGILTLCKNSPAIGTATDGTNLGDPRWGVSDKDVDPSQLPYTLYKVPYSMSPTTSSVRILWQTEDTVSLGKVRYGMSPDDLTQETTARDGWYVEGEGYVHVVELTGLQPFTRYYYAVGDGTREDTIISSCKTAPDINTAFRIFMISDIHENACNNWENEQTYITQTLNPDFAMFIGDFVNHGWDRAWNESFFNPGKPFLRQVTFSGAIGNHETYLADGTLEEGFTNYHTYYDYFSSFSHGESEGAVIDPRGEAYFSFNYGDAQIICLNLNNNYDDTYDSPSFAVGSKQYNWLDQQLKNSTSKWILIYAHVGITTSGYHGQWNDENHSIIRPLLEQYAKAGKHIICFAGDDHSFEHAQKDGVNYVRPGCGRNSNYAQVTSLPDAAYTLMYRQVSCFSTLDMAADGNSIRLTTYDSVGTSFYSYTFSLSDKPLPAVYITQPNAAQTIFSDSVEIRYSAASTSDATVNLYYNTTEKTTDGTLIAADLDGSNGMHSYVWKTRYVEPKGMYYIYATITNADTTIVRIATTPITLVADTIAPPAPADLRYKTQGKQLTIFWKNPTHLLHKERILTSSESGIENFQSIEEADEGTVKLSTTEGRDGGTAIHIDYTIAKAWGQGNAAYVFPDAEDISDTYMLSFWYRGDGAARNLRIVVYNDVNADNKINDSADDWWYNESLSLGTTIWKQATLDMRQFDKFTWHTNQETANNCSRTKAIHFIIPGATAGTGTIDIEDIVLSSEVYPAPDYAGTLILRKTDTYSADITDGEIIYEGTDEQCIDKTLDINKPYYYTAFAYDDMHNYSTAATLYYDPAIPTTVLDYTAVDNKPNKMFRNGQLLILYNNNIYNLVGDLVQKQ